MAQEETTTDASAKVLASSSSNPLSLNVYRPYLVEITDGDSVKTTSTVFKDPESILAYAGFDLRPEDRFTIKHNDSIDESLVGVELYIDRAMSIELNLYGIKTSVLTQSNIVGQLLGERDITLGQNDVVEPSLSTALTPGTEVSVHKVGIEVVIVEEDIDFRRDFIDNPNVVYGVNTVKTPGVKGRAKVTYEITYSDGVEVLREKTRSITVKESVDEIVIRGVKGKPASNGPLTPEQIQFLGSCEAGMNPTRNSGNGYYGAFQFSAGTWNAMNTGYARADLAPLDVQIQAVQQLLSRSSIFGQFPGCANAMVSAGLL